MTKYLLISLLFLTSFLHSASEDITPLKEALQNSQTHAVAQLLKELSLEKQKIIIPELLKEATAIKNNRVQNLTLLKPSWDSAKFFGGLVLAGTSAYIGQNSTNNLLTALGLFYTYRGTQYLYQKKRIKAASDIEALLTDNSLPTEKEPKDWYQTLGSPQAGLITTTMALSLEALKGNHFARNALALTGGVLAAEHAAKFAMDLWHALPIIPEDWQSAPIKDQLINAIESSDIRRTSVSLHIYGKDQVMADMRGTFDPEEEKELFRVLSQKASEILKQRKNQLLLPKTFAEKVRMAGGTTLALLGLCAQGFIDNRYVKKAGILASCFGLYEGYHGLRRSAQRDLYQQAEIIKNMIDDRLN